MLRRMTLAGRVAIVTAEGSGETIAVSAGFRV
jgi:hypothetical protein